MASDAPSNAIDTADATTAHTAGRSSGAPLDLMFPLDHRPATRQVLAKYLPRLAVALRRLLTVRRVQSHANTRRHARWLSIADTSSPRWPSGPPSSAWPRPAPRS